MAAATSAEEIRIDQFVVRFLVEAEATAGGAAMFEFDVPPVGRTPVAHSHDSWEETVYGLRGTLTWTVDGVTSEVGPGEVLVIPRGAVHRFDNHGSEVATQLAIVTPGVLGPAYFRELAAIVEEAQGPPDPMAFVAVMRRHGLTPAR